MANAVIITADSTCDLGEELKTRYHITYYPYHIILENRQYTDGVDVMPADLYRAWRERRALPKTAAIAPEEYIAFFRPWVEQGREVVHINLGSALSAAHQNCLIAAEALGGVYPVDSCSLSTGAGLLALEAAERAAAGMPAAQIQAEVAAMTPRAHASFILDTLEFMHAGGRCSSVARLGANLLRMKPCIEVNAAQNGAMEVGKKYRGNLEKVLPLYVRDCLAGRTDLVKKRVFITHSGIPEERIDLVRRAVRETADFEAIHVTRASCTISAHCGPNTLGVLFLTGE